MSLHSMKPITARLTKNGCDRRGSRSRTVTFPLPIGILHGETPHSKMSISVKDPRELQRSYDQHFESQQAFPMLRDPITWLWALAKFRFKQL